MSGKLTGSARHPWFIALVVCAGIPRPSVAQSLLAIADEAAECAVQLREVLRLGDPGDPGVIGSRPEITRTAAGHYIVASVENRGRLLVFDSAGAFPEINRRITHLSPDGGLIETTDIRSLHGLDFAAIDRGERYVVSAPVAVDGRRRVWTTRAGGYGFEAWDAEGGSEPVTRLVGDPEWFDPGPPRPGAPVSAPAPSIVISLRVDRGLVWAGPWVADENWEANTSAVPLPLFMPTLAGPGCPSSISARM